MKYSKTIIKTAILFTTWVLTLSINEAVAQPRTFDPPFNSVDTGLGFGDSTPTTFWAAKQDGKILVTTTKNNLIRLNAAGSQDATFNIGTGPAGGNSISAPFIASIVIQSDGKTLLPVIFSV